MTCHARTGYRRCGASPPQLSSGPLGRTRSQVFNKNNNMGTFNKLKYSWDSVSMVSTLISKWSPRKCVTEKDYEQSLLKFLNKEIPEIKVTPQYAIGRTKADLLIGDRVIVEIKKDLTSTAQYRSTSRPADSLQRVGGQSHSPPCRYNCARP